MTDTNRVSVAVIGLPSSGNRVISHTLRRCARVSRAPIYHMFAHMHIAKALECDIIVEPWCRDEQARRRSVAGSGSNPLALDDEQIELRRQRVATVAKIRTVHRVCLEDLVESRGESFPDVGLRLDWGQPPIKGRSLYTGGLISPEEFAVRRARP